MDTEKKSRKGIGGGSTGVEFKAMRWKLFNASHEFGMAKETLSKNLNNLGIMPGIDGCWSTMDICKAKYGDLESERIRKTREEADAQAMANEERRRTLVNIDLVFAFCQEFAVTVRQVILGSNMTAEEKDEVLAELKSLQDARIITKRITGA